MVMENGIGYESEPFEEESILKESEATQAVQVALNIRPLIALEQIQGCKDCITVIPGEPQVDIFLNIGFSFRVLVFLLGPNLEPIYSGLHCLIVSGCLRKLRFLSVPII